MVNGWYVISYRIHCIFVFWNIFYSLFIYSLNCLLAKSCHVLGVASFLSLSFLGLSSFFMLSYSFVAFFTCFGVVFIFVVIFTFLNFWGLLHFRGHFYFLVLSRHTDIQKSWHYDHSYAPCSHGQSVDHVDLPPSLRIFDKNHENLGFEFTFSIILITFWGSGVQTERHRVSWLGQIE